MLWKWSTGLTDRSKPSRAYLNQLLGKFAITDSFCYDVEVWQRKEDHSDGKEHRLHLEMYENIRAHVGIESTHQLDIRTEHLDLNLFSYKIQVHQRLSTLIEQHFDFVNEICRHIDEQHFNVKRFVFTAEAHFWLDGYFNWQNYCI
ncbi:hypothetical protein CEXT_789851 [Caerostris extrusa]|uniref:Uncharacterized protein n=1 Tax=Caerostris extrusa TaxID=172846 RepID=A0AAV4W6E6_CAEEX|nr:hypothetical protein CEXT_789851 [Caerostris extrusa]